MHGYFLKFMVSELMQAYSHIQVREGTKWKSGIIGLNRKNIKSNKINIILIKKIIYI